MLNWGSVASLHFFFAVPEVSVPQRARFRSANVIKKASIASIEAFLILMLSFRS